MPAWKYIPTSINGVAIVGGSVASAYFKVANGPLFTQKVGDVMAEIPGLGSRDVRGQPQPAVLRLVVNLSGVNQADLKALHTLFNEEAGLVYLRITDGDAVVWRSAVRVLGIEPVNTLQFEVVLSQPNALWEEDALNTNSQLAKQTSPINLAPTNAGDRKARPKFVFTASAAKDGTLDDYRVSLRGFIQNRAPNPLNNYPVWLFDSSATQARLATDSSATGTTVKQTTGATTLSAPIIVSDVTIPLTSAAGFSANGGIAYITDGAFDEQFYYTGKAGNSLTGCVRGIGGTNAVGHGAGIAVNPSGTLKNGDDVLVYINDVPVRSDVVAWNTAASDVVVPVTAPKMIKLSLTAGMSSTDTSVSFNESLSEMDPKGFISVGNEVIYYSSRVGHTLLGLVRGAWGTAAVVHLINAAVYANPIRYLVACGYAKAPFAQRPISGRPALQLPGSSNQVFKWGDETDDANTVYFDPDSPDRPMSWSMGFDSDGNTVSPLMQASATKTALQFKDDVPGDGSPVYNNAEIALPTGIKTADVNAVKNDWTPAAEVLNLELFARDAGGKLKLLDQLQQSAAAAARPLPAVLASIAYGLKLKARYNVCTGHRGSGSEVDVNNTSNYGDGTVAQRFVLERDFLFAGVTLLIRRGAANQNIDIRILDDVSGNAPVSTFGLSNQPFYAKDVPVTSAVASLLTVTPEVPVLIPAGTYHLVVHRSAPQTNQIFWTFRTSASRYRGKCFAARLITPSWAVLGSPSADLYFLLNGAYLNDGSAPINSDQPVKAVTSALRTGLTASFDKTIIDLQTSPTQYARVHRNTVFVSGATFGAMFHLKGVLTNTTTGESIAIDKWMKPGSTLAIDCDLRTVIYTEDGIDYALTKAIAPSNTADWLTLAPGANAINFTDASLLAPGQLDLVTTWRGVRA